jgi:hypothetical protein
MRVYNRRAFRYNPGMSETVAPPPPKKGMNCGMWIVLGVLGVIGIGISLPAFNGVSKRSRMLTASSNARQIMIALKSYAGGSQWTLPGRQPTSP